MADSEPRLSPQFTDVVHRVHEAQEEALSNMLRLEESVEGSEAARDLELEQATFDFNILSAMARPLEMLGLSAHTRPGDVEPTAENIPPIPPGKSLMLPPEKRHPTIEKLAEKLLVHVIDNGGRFERGAEKTAAGRARRDLGLTNYYLQKARGELEARGLLRSEPVPGSPDHVQAYILEREALLEAAQREELSPGVLRAIANRRKTPIATTSVEIPSAQPPEETTISDSPQSQRKSGLSDHLSSQRAQRAAVSRPTDQQESTRKKASRKMSWYIRDIHGELFSATISARNFSQLQDADKLLLAVILVRSAKFASIYDDSQKIRSYLLSMVNKGRDKEDIMYVDDEGLQQLIEVEIERGRLEFDDTGPLLSKSGLGHLQAEKKRKKQW